MDDIKRNSRARIMLIVGIIIMWVSIVLFFIIPEDNLMGRGINSIIGLTALGLIIGSFKYNHGSITMSTSAKKAKIFLIVFVIVLFIGTCISIGVYNKQQSDKQTQEFEDQMKQDPSTWNKQQRDRYNDFIEWEDKQKENK